MTGYLMGVHGTWKSKNDLVVFEVFGVDADSAAALLSAAKIRSRSGVLTLAGVSLSNPVREVLSGLNISCGESTPQIMARIIKPDRIFKLLSEGTGLADTAAVTVTTPHRTVLLSSPESPRYHVQLEMKESFLSRLLMCRLDFQAALDMECIRWADRDTGVEGVLHEVFRFSDWIQWFSDYV